MSQKEVLKQIEDISTMTLYDVVAFHGFEHPHEPAVHYMGYKLTYSDLITRIDKTADYLVSLGVKKGMHIALNLPNSVSFVCLFYALNKIGAVSVLTSPVDTAFELCEKLIQSDCTGLFYLENFSKNILQTLELLDENTKQKLKICSMVPISNSLPLHLKLLTVTESIKSKKYNMGIKALLKESLKPYNVKNPLPTVFPVNESPHSPAAILFSGGTTGISKAAVHSSYSINTSTKACIDTKLPIFKGDSFLSVLPAFHIFGLSVSLHIALACGCRSILLPNFRAKQTTKAFIKQKPNFFAAVPFMVEKMLATGLLQGVVKYEFDTSFFRQAFIGGDCLKTSVRDEFNSLIKKGGGEGFIESGYGLTENCPVSFNHSICGNPKSVGTPFGKTEVIIVDKTNQLCPQGDIGEICLFSPSNFLCYYKDNRETRRVFVTHEDKKLWLHTGDMGFIDDDGNLCFSYRQKKILKISGNSILAPVIEECICSISFVKNVCVTVTDDILTAYVIVAANEKDKHSDKGDEIKAHCASYLSKTHIPKKVVICTINELPVNLLGKISFGRL